MKRFYSISFFVILISLLAAGAYAQSDDGECTEQKTRNLNYDEEWGNGGTARHGADFVEDGGPHGPMDGDLNKDYDDGLHGEDGGQGDGAMGEDGAQGEDALKERKLNYDEEWGNGGTVRNGGDYAEEGGPHGPVGDGPDDVDKMFIDEDLDGFNDLSGEGMSQLGSLGLDATKTQSGQMLRNDYGPGEAGVETPVGPQDSPHFGPGESSGEGEPVVNSDPVQSRSGRR